MPEEHPVAPYEGDYSIDPEPEFAPESLGMPTEAELAAEAGEGLELSEILEGVGEGGEVAAEAEGIREGKFAETTPPRLCRLVHEYSHRATSGSKP